MNGFDSPIRSTLYDGTRITTTADDIGGVVTIYDSDRQARFHRARVRDELVHTGQARILDDYLEEGWEL